MTKKIFVGGLAWATREDELQEAFAQFGAISEAKVITDRESGRSRGFGFVTFEEENSVEEAITSMNGQELAGRKIRVDRAEERRPRD